MTLNDYANDREHVVAFVAGVGNPTGEELPLGGECDFAEGLGLLDLIGTVDADGDWRWDGEGDPRDERGNSITKVSACVDRARWDELTAE